jgi:hypothetical protein
LSNWYFFLSRCGVYFISATGTLGQPAKLKRNDLKVKIFDFENNFKPALLKFKANDGPRPDPTVHLVFGQKCTLDELNEDMLITLTVTSMKADECLEQPTEEVSCIGHHIIN